MPADAEPSRRPLLQRAAIHALKVLVRKHPRAALHAAGAGTSYAIRDLAAHGMATVRAWTGLNEGPATLENACDPEPKPPVRKTRASRAKTTVRPKRVKLPRHKVEAFVEQLSEDEREALADFARKHGSDHASG